MLLIYLGLIDAVRSCAKTQQVVTELHATKYVCTRTETTMTRCVFTECTYDTPGGQGSIISILLHFSTDHITVLTKSFVQSHEFLQCSYLWTVVVIVVALKWYHWPSQSECQNKEETTCMIQSSDGQIFGDVSCTKYALERLSDSIKKPILAYLKEQENDRLRQLDSEVRLFWPRDKAITTVHIQ